MACAGDVPTLETLAAVTEMRKLVPDIRIRVVNVVDLMSLQPPANTRMALPDEEFDAMFTEDQPVIFAFHGYPWLIHRFYIVVTTTTIFTFVAIKRKAPQPRLST